MTHVVLVDEHDVEIGVADKLAAHRQPPQLHRAFSAFLRDPDGRLLLQRRSVAKYHFGGLWANSCCGHPLPGESVVDAAARRTQDELGTSAIGLRAVSSVIYSADDPHTGLAEHEFDHIVVGTLAEHVMPDPLEVAEVRFVVLAELVDELAAGPEHFAPWVAPALAAAIPFLT
jgi:isopentenyl-diphosphate delta-isomerase